MQTSQSCTSLHAGISTLPNNLGSEIDFVMWRSNARTELGDEDPKASIRNVVCIAAIGFGRNRRRGSFLAGVHQPDAVSNWIEKIHRATIGDVNSKRDAALIRNQAITFGETLFGLHGRVDHCDAIAMHLLCGKERRMFEA